jgi:hypothetical protein
MEEDWFGNALEGRERRKSGQRAMLGSVRRGVARCIRVAVSRMLTVVDAGFVVRGERAAIDGRWIRCSVTDVDAVVPVMRIGRCL